MAISPQKIQPEARGLAERITTDFSDNAYDKWHFSFNGAADWFDLNGQQCRTLLNPDKKTNDQRVKKELKIHTYGHRVSPLWTIVQKFSNDKWDNLMRYSNTGENPLLFDCLLYNSRRGTWKNYSLFRCIIPCDKSGQYTIVKEQLTGDNKWLFQKVEMKIIKKEDRVIVVVKLLDAAFYERYRYVIVE